MWARHCEVFLGLWLAISWLIFSYPSNLDSLMYFDWIICLLICIFSLSCYSDRFKYMHLMNILIGSILIGFVFTFADDPYLPPYQNYAVVGLLLLMFAIIPTNSSLPPKAWQNFFTEKKEQG